MGVLENLKDAALVAQKVGQIELYKQILQAEDEVRELTREKRRLEDTVEELGRKLSLKAAMTFQAPAYYQKGDATPFCAACYEENGRPVHLNKTAKPGTWVCPVCKNYFSTTAAPDDGPAFGIAPMGR